MYHRADLTIFDVEYLELALRLDLSMGAMKGFQCQLLIKSFSIAMMVNINVTNYEYMCGVRVTKPLIGG